MSSHAEQDPLLPRSSSHISRMSNNSQHRAVSRSERARDVAESPELAHASSGSSHGPMLPGAPVADSHISELHNPRWAEHEGQANVIARVRYIWREELAECLGTAMIILFGASVQCQTVLHYSNDGKRVYTFGDYNTCLFAWAAGVASAIWVAGGISGGHVNPTVTICLWLYRGFPGRKVGWFIGAQVLGAMLAALVVYSNYRFSIARYEGGGMPSSMRTVTGPHATAGLFFTFPQPWLPASSAFLSEAIGSATLVLLIFTLTDKGNLPTPKGTMAMAMFIVLIGIGASMGVNTGYAINGARDAGPRLALYILGYGKEVWTHNNAYWAWGPWAGSIAGGCVGGLIYDVCVYTGKDSFLNRPLNPKRSSVALPADD